MFQCTDGARWIAKYCFPSSNASEGTGNYQHKVWLRLEFNKSDNRVLINVTNPNIDTNSLKYSLNITFMENINK